MKYKRLISGNEREKTEEIKYNITWKKENGKKKRTAINENMRSNNMGQKSE